MVEMWKRPPEGRVLVGARRSMERTPPAYFDEYNMGTGCEYEREVSSCVDEILEEAGVLAFDKYLFPFTGRKDKAIVWERECSQDIEQRSDAEVSNYGKK